MSRLKKSLFIFYLTAFLGVMNFVVLADDILLFFFGFELTTLASYLLISFRGDVEARANGIRALWMNQIGGVLILFGALAHEYSLSLELIAVLIVLAGLIKGAQLPFNSWLIGAMVAPTPVSAILHSATMVKIAPFLTLKYSHFFSTSASGFLITLFGAFVFMMASYIGLAQTKLKPILGYSTIAMLGLMVSIASIGGESATTLVYTLIIFHALSKALLFIVAGILEKLYGLKEIDDMQGLISLNPFLTTMIIVGFATIVLPPFGLFFAKVFSIELFAHMLHTTPLYLVPLIFIALGSVILTLLYFKVGSAIIVSKDFHEDIKTPFVFKLIPTIFLLLIILLSLYVFDVFWLFVSTFGLLIPLYLSTKIKAKRVREYNCAEQSDFNILPFSFSLSSRSFYITQGVAIGLFIVILGASL